MATSTQLTDTLLDPTSLITPSRTLRTLTRPQISFLITQGHILTIHRGLVYRLNNWLSSHPGGALPVLHFVGRDATDEIEAYHPVFALKQMRCFVVAKVDGSDYEDESVFDGVGWKPLVPPVHLGWPGRAEAYERVPSLEQSLKLMRSYEATCGFPKEGPSPSGTNLPFLSTADLEPSRPPPSICPIEQQRLSISFRKLRHDLLQEPGLFDPDPLPLYKNTIIRCSLLFASFLGFYLLAQSKWHYAISAVSLGLWMHQIMFCAHDAGHTEITGDRWWDRVIGGTIASFASGMSLGWWIDQHDVHHLVTNHPEHDPDIQLMPFFAFTTRFFDSLYSTFHDMIIPFDAASRFLVQYQHFVFYPLMVFARFSLFGKSYYYLATKAKPDGFRAFEMVGVVFFWVWYTFLLKGMGTGLEGWITRIGYTLLVLISVCPIHVQIVLSHSAQDSEDMGVYESFVHRQLRTTMDVSCPDYLDFIHGGLQMQIAHHLFPRLPRHNLRRATVHVKRWAAANGVEFKEKSFVRGNEQMFGMLAEIAGQCRALMDTAEKQAKGLIVD